MDIDAGDLADFLAVYTDARDRPMPVNILIALVEAMLTETVAACELMH